MFVCVCEEMSLAYARVKEIELFVKTYLRSVLFYGIVFNVTRGLLGMKISPVPEDRIWSGVKACCKEKETLTFARPSYIYVCQRHQEAISRILW